MYLLIQANDVKEAYDNTISVMKDTMGEYSVPSIAESPIMDVFPYFSGEEDDMERVEKFNIIKDSIPAVAEVIEEDPIEAETEAEVEA